MTTSPRRGRSSAIPVIPVDTSERPSPVEPASPLDEVTRLTNRTAVQTFLTAFAFVAGLVALPRVLEGASVPGRLLAALPMVAALALAAWGLRLRAELRRARDRSSSRHTGRDGNGAPVLR